MDEVEVERKPGIYPNIDDIIADDDAPTLLLPCIICNKTFKPEVLQRHSKVCEKNTSKKRKVFDSFKQRVQGTELAEFLPFSSLQKRVSISEKQPSSIKTSNHWKENHEAFVSAIRAARGEGTDALGGSGEPRSLIRPSGHEQCPYCERHFGPKAFDRHQEWCREQHSRQPPVTASSLAKERLEARIKYRAPPLKSKRAITREKYSPLVQRKVRQVSPSNNSSFSSTPAGSAISSAGSTRHTSQSQQEQSNRLSKSGNLLSGRSQVPPSGTVPNALGFNRGMAGRTSLRASQRLKQRSTSPVKSSSTSSRAVPISSAQRLSFDGLSSEIGDKPEMLVTSTNLKKLHSRNAATRQNDSKVVDTQRMKNQKKESHSSSSSPKSQTLHIEQMELDSKEPKESLQNNKSPKNDHLWRQGCYAKHTSSHSLVSSTLTSATSSNVTPRSLSQEKGKRGRCSFHSKINSIAVNSYVPDMVVRPCGQLTPPEKESRFFEDNRSICSLTESRPFEEGIFYADHLDECDDAYVNNSNLIDVPDIETASSVSVQCSSSTEASISSSGSAFSNRTYVTLSSTCKMDNLQGMACEQYVNSSSATTVTSNVSFVTGQPILEKNISNLNLDKKLKISDGDCLSTTWCDIAKSGNQRSQYFTMNTHSRLQAHSRTLCTLKPFLKEGRNMNTNGGGDISVSPISLHKKPIRNDEKLPAMDLDIEKSDILSHTNVRDKFDNRKRKGRCHLKELQLPSVVSSNAYCQQPLDGFLSQEHVTSDLRTHPINLNRKKPSSLKLKPLPFSLVRSGSSRAEPYDPYASAERQMMELLRSDSACTINQAANMETKKMKSQKNKVPSPCQSLSPMSSPTLSPKPSPLETSPTSAFTRYTKDPDTVTQHHNDSDSGTANELKDSGVGEVVSMGKTELQLCRSSDSATLSILPNEPPVDPQIQHKPQLDLPKSVTRDLLQTHPVKEPEILPQPPPRSNKRLAPVQQSRNHKDLVVSGTSASHTQLQTSVSLDLVPNTSNDAENSDLDDRPKTYDVDSNPKKESCDKNRWCDSRGSSTFGDFEIPELTNGGKVEILNLENRDMMADRHETRDSREIRDITDQESNIADIDNLLEEVVRMQRSVSMLSDVDSANNKDPSQIPLTQTSSARSRRNRAGKMHIEDFLFPADFQERGNNNFRSVEDFSERSSSVFGSTKSRKASSKGRRLIEDMLFPPGIDYNANTHSTSEDGDVVVSANALPGSHVSSASFATKFESVFPHFSTSPIALTSKAPSDHGDDLHRPKPISISTHSSSGNGRSGGNEIVSTNPMQPPNQSQQSNSSRLSADSAYSSLNRKSPVPHIRRQGTVGMQDVRHGTESPSSVLSQSFTQSLALSSSGSESSLPPLLASQSSKRGGRGKRDCDTPSSDIVSATTPLLPKLSKFCHQCGTKFLVTASKFCHECGAARLEFC